MKYQILTKETAFIGVVNGEISANEVKLVNINMKGKQQIAMVKNEEESMD